MEPKRQKLDPDKVNETNYDIFNINDFPDEVIEKIFSFLTQNQLGQIARVCRKWSMLAKSPVLWRMVDMTIFCSSDKEKNAQSVESFIDGLPSCVTFIRLQFSDPAGFYMHLVFEKLCMKLHHRCPHLEVLILTRCYTLTNLSEVINFCTQFLQDLKKLVLHSCRFFGCSESVELEDNSKIEYLDLYWSYHFDRNKIRFSKFLSLKELHLARTDANDSWFEDDAPFLNQLHVLDLRFTKISTTTFLAIQRHGQNLKELYLCALYLHDRDLNNFVFPHLKTICLSHTLVTCEGLVSLVRSCPSLVNVYVKEDVVQSFAEHPFVVANRCKSGIVKSIAMLHNHSVDYSHS